MASDARGHGLYGILWRRCGIYGSGLSWLTPSIGRYAIPGLIVHRAQVHRATSTGGLQIVHRLGPFAGSPSETEDATNEPNFAENAGIV